jgi:hypothetical protein
VERSEMQGRIINQPAVPLRLIRLRSSLDSKPFKLDNKQAKALRDHGFKNSAEQYCRGNLDRNESDSAGIKGASSRIKT